MSDNEPVPKKKIYVLDGQRYEKKDLVAALRLAPLLRKRIKAIEGGVGGRNWRAQEETRDILRNVLKEAGFES